MLLGPGLCPHSVVIPFLRLGLSGGWHGCVRDRNEKENEGIIEGKAPKSK